MVSATFSPVFTGTVLLSTITRYWLGLEHGGDFTGDLLDVGEIHAAIGLRRSGHRDENDVGVVHAFLGARR